MTQTTTRAMKRTKRMTAAQKVAQMTEVVEYGRSFYFGGFAWGSPETMIGDAILEGCNERSVERAISCVERLRGRSDTMDALIDTVIAQIEAY